MSVCIYISFVCIYIYICVPLGSGILILRSTEARFFLRGLCCLVGIRQ